MPHVLHASAMISNPKEVILIGGHIGTDKYGFSKDIYILRNDGTKWMKSEISLNFGRHSHVALPIPRSLVDCSKCFLIKISFIV